MKRKISVVLPTETNLSSLSDLLWSSQNARWLLLSLQVHVLLIITSTTVAIQYTTLQLWSCCLRLKCDDGLHPSALLPQLSRHDFASVDESCRNGRRDDKRAVAETTNWMMNSICLVHHREVNILTCPETMLAALASALILSRCRSIVELLAAIRKL